MIYVCDMDHTISDASRRCQDIFGCPKVLDNHPATPDQWDAFFDPQRMLEDTPIRLAVRCVKKFRDTGKIAICTGRLQKRRRETRQWLDHHDIQYSWLFMRPEWCSNGLDFKCATISNLREMFPDQRIVVFDDDSRVLEAVSPLPDIEAHLAPGCWDHEYRLLFRNHHDNG